MARSATWAHSPRGITRASGRRGRCGSTPAPLWRSSSSQGPGASPRGSQWAGPRSGRGSQGRPKRWTDRMAGTAASSAMAGGGSRPRRWPRPTPTQSRAEPATSGCASTTPNSSARTSMCSTRSGEGASGSASSTSPSKSARRRTWATRVWTAMSGPNARRRAERSSAGTTRSARRRPATSPRIGSRPSNLRATAKEKKRKTAKRRCWSGRQGWTSIRTRMIGCGWRPLPRAGARTLRDSAVDRRGWLGAGFPTPTLCVFSCRAG
mmetsp:Transcript_15676/g.49954  ORF Transcript_15676/g.49954 Transcript_15676/m.49954 type:complete len:265 (+) Transcript_15676:486-1280(+)